MKKSQRDILFAFVLAMLYLPIQGFCQDTSKAVTIERQIQAFDYSSSLQSIDTSSCRFYDLEEDRRNCLDKWQTTTDKGHPNIIRFTVENGRRGKFLDKKVYYYINKKLCKITALKQENGRLLWDSEIYLADDVVIFQKDKLAKVNAAHFIQDAKTKIVW